MNLTSNNSDYTATHTGTKMRLFHKRAFQCELEIKSYTQAKTILEDWERLKISPTQVIAYQELIKEYVGATVDDVTVGKDGKYYINDKLVSEI